MLWPAWLSTIFRHDVLTGRISGMNWNPELVASLLLLAACGVAAFLLMKKFGPAIEDAKKADSLLDFTGRVLASLDAQQQRDATKFGSRRKTLVIGLVNTTFLLGWCSLVTVSVNAFYGVLLYLVVGGFMNWKLMKARMGDGAALGFLDRLWLIIFHAWFWPLYWWAVRANRSAQ